MSTLDKRLHAHRDDLADESLKGRVTAARFVKPVTARCILPLASVHRAPSHNAMQLTQALLGEQVQVFEQKNGWAWVQLQRDGYVGYVEEAAVGETGATTTHIVTARSTHLYPSADLKTQPATAIAMLSELTVTGQSGDFCKTSSSHFVFTRHLEPATAADFVSVAEEFLHTPYLWGGKSVWGIDCSGLVQVALQAAGMTALRDSDMQEQSLGTAIAHQDLKRGDLVFWKGHVGIMQDAETLLHANGHHMKVVSEPLQRAVERIKARGSEITSIKRL